MPSLIVFASVWLEPVSAPWPVQEPTEFGQLRLWGSMTDAELNLFVALLANYCRVRLADTPEAAIAQLADQEYLVIGGGVQASDGATVTTTGCCVGAESWREWESLRHDPFGGPWTGHDPEVWVEPTDDGFIVKSVLTSRTNEFPDVAKDIHFTHAEMESAIALIARDMADFLERLSDWAHALAPSVADRFVKAIDYGFEITAARQPQS